jgi:pimeloyl-ACP methyl ester carboxylesterase
MQSQPKSAARLGRRLITAVGWALGLLIALLLGLPVILLPLTTAVPAWVWVPLALAGLAFIALPLRLRPIWPGAAFSLAGMLLVAILAVTASQAFAATPPITGPDGKPLPGSIAVLEKIDLNGAEQWITIRGHDASKPILLHLGMGGPGGGGFATRSFFEPLEKDFVVVSWDEPGTGKSYRAVPLDELTTQRFISDAHALTLYLRDRFKQDKIYVYGVSWTSILGIWLVQRYPELYYAYIGNGQMINTTQNDIMGYELAMDYLAEKDDAAALEALRRKGPPPYRGKGMLGKYVAYLDVLNDYMGAPRYTVIVPIIPFVAPEYGLLDKINHTRGLIDSFQVVYPQLEDLDFTTQAVKLDVPVYIFAGRDDVNAMSSLVEDYVNRLGAPHKQLIWLQGGHGLGTENLAQFTDVMVNTVLAETYPKK